jgi:hypothetical protein
MKGNFLRVGTQQLTIFLSDLEQFSLYVSRPPTIAAHSAILLSKNRNNLTFFFLICLFVDLRLQRPTPTLYLRKISSK